jgi:archaellum component FlaC
MTASISTPSHADSISKSVSTIPTSPTLAAADTDSSPVMSTAADKPIDDAKDFDPEIDRPSSPRREHDDIERLGQEKAQVLQAEAANIQESLAGIVDRIARIKEEYERLSSENKFLQDYIGNLMSTGNLISK